MSAYIPPHRRRQESGTSTSGTSNQPRLRQEPKNKQVANHDDGETPLFCRVFPEIRCINLQHRTDRWKSFLSRKQRGLGGDARRVHVRRFNAIHGAELRSDHEQRTIVCREWDATLNAQYDRHIEPPMIKQMSPGEIGCAMSHVKLWEELVKQNDRDEEDHHLENFHARFLILEDDATFYSGSSHNQQRRNSSAAKQPAPFFQVFERLWKIVPDDWDILYFGFSDRGARSMVTPKNSSFLDDDDKLGKDIWLFRPTYGFHTHAYAIRAAAAQTLLSQLPIEGPVDVWLADNQWFGLQVYCAVVANEGWKGQGAPLISQRRHDTRSDIHQSGRLAG